MAKIKMVGSTPNSSESPCDTCKYLTRIKGQRDEYRYCSAVKERLTMQVSDCSEYENHNHPSLYDMQRLAWSLSADKKGHSVGFLSPSQLERAINEGKVTRPEWISDDD